MPKKKKEYYDLKRYIKESGVGNVIPLANDIYETWLKDTNKNIIELASVSMTNSPSSEIEIMSEKTKQKTISTPSTNMIKFDWEKYLDENPKFKGKDEKSGVEVLLLQFFKDLLHKEGFTSIRYIPLGAADQGYCGLSCEIVWRNGQLTSGIADTHFNNCKSFTKYYLAAMSENRSLIRAVKAYFNIPYLGKDEIGDAPKEDEPKRSGDAPTGPDVTLRNKVKSILKISEFDNFKTFLRNQVKEDKKSAWLKEDEYSDWANYSDWHEINKKKILELVGLINEYKK